MCPQSAGGKASFTTPGGQTSGAVAHKCTCEGCAPPACLWSLQHCRISLETACRERLFHYWRLHGGTRHRAGAGAAALAGGAARKGACLGAEWHVLPAGGGIWESLENSFEKRFDLLCIGWLQLLELVKAKPDAVD